MEIWINENSETGDALLASNILAALERVGVTKNRGTKEAIGMRTARITMSTGTPTCPAV